MNFVGWSAACNTRCRDFKVHFRDVVSASLFEKNQTGCEYFDLTLPIPKPGTIAVKRKLEPEHFRTEKL